MNESLRTKLASLTDEEVSNCLSGLLHGLTIENQDFARLLETPEEMEKVVKEAADNKVEAAQLETSSLEQQAQARRLLLGELAELKEFEGPIEAWIDGARPTMLVPLAVPLVLAGIVLVLSTDIHIEYKKENGKKKIHFELRKSKTSEKILKKFFGLFGG